MTEVNGIRRKKKPPFLFVDDKEKPIIKGAAKDEERCPHAIAREQREDALDADLHAVAAV